MANDVVRYGKIRYFEPNHIIQDKQYGEWKTDRNGERYLHSEAYNIPYNMDDYCIAVDLIVNIPKRIGDAETESKTHEISLVEKGEPISFFGGTDGFMTDTPGSTTYYDILNKDFGGTEESLGITNIHIAYNSYFYPQVTIKFTDVRGAALMMPHEENYRRKKINELGGKERYDTSVENFFAALFTFPYPDFKLRVKGFYGKMIEYTLVVEDFRSAFNPQTGNFDATVKFIGKMFGVYTDIPMSYLLMAPYCRYGGKNNQTIWQNRNFEIEEGTPMPTLIELRERILMIQQKLEANMNYAKVQEYTQIQKSLSSLSIIKTAYQKLLTHLNKTYGASVTQGVILGKPFVDDLYLFKMEDNKCEYLYENNKLLELTRNIYNLIADYNASEYSNTQLPFLGGMTEGESKIGLNGEFPYLTFRKGQSKGEESGVFIISSYVDDNIGGTTGILYSLTSKLFLSDDGSEKEIEILRKSYPYIVDGVIKYMFKQEIGTEVKFAALYCGKMTNALNTIEQNLKSRLSSLKKEIDDGYTERLTQLLGFSPSIRNIFKIVMTHLHVFVEIYASFLDNVTGINTRKLSQYGLHFDETDVPHRGGSFTKNDMPPFPGIKNKLTNEFAYPDGIIRGVMEETNLIDSFFDGMFLMLKEKQETDDEIDALKDETVGFIPTCISDFVILNNPYEYVIDSIDSTIGVDWIMTFLGIRSIVYFLLEQNTKLSNTEFGKCEAYNFWRANKTLDKDIINKIKSADFNVNNYNDFLLGKGGKYSFNGKPCYAFINNQGDKQNNLLYPNNGFVGIPTTTNFPGAIGRDSGGFATFISDMDESRVPKYSYTLSKRTLYNYIQFIEPETLKGWNERIMADDLKGVVDEDKKNRLIEVYLTPYKNIFNTGNIKYTDKVIEEKDFFIKHSGKSESHNEYNSYKSLSDYYNDGLKDEYIFYSMADKQNIPIFFVENLTSEIFLSSIPFNFKSIWEKMYNGSSCITMPYSLQLFLGLCIEKIKERSFGEFLKRNLPKEEEQKNLIKILYFVLLQEDGTIVTSAFNGKDGNLKGTTDENITKLQQVCKKDYLSLEEKYNRWADEYYPGSFKYFKNQYTLRKSISAKEANAFGVLQNICSKLANSDESTYKSIQKKFNEAFMWQNRNKEDKKISSDFSDRYGSVRHYAKEGTILGFNPNFEAYRYLKDFFSAYSLLTFPYKQLNSRAFTNATNFTDVFTAFKNKLLELYGTTNTETGDETVDYGEFSSVSVTEESKLSMYLTLKNLQDKHFANLHNERENYAIDDKRGNKVKNSEWDRFHFINTFYKDIGDELLINIEQLSNLINIVLDSPENGNGNSISQSQMSLFSFMAKICEEHNLMFLALPVFNGTFRGTDGEENLVDMFRPIPYNEAIENCPMKGPSYVCFYSFQPSKHLDIPNAEYENDGFSISDNMNDYVAFEDISDTANFLGPTSIPDLYTDDEDGLIIPAFGVEYGVQNQSIFKSVNVNMDNPMVTEHSVAAQFNIANGKQTEQRKMSFEGQNLFDIYSNHSYTCNVEMMGCSQIQPLMYFQLNNIPMFRGAYQIISVEHDITPGNMTTSFRGVRINKNKMPMVKTGINFSLLNDWSSKSSYDSAKTQKYNPEFIGELSNDNLDSDGMDSVPSDVNYTYEKCTQDLGKWLSFEKMSSHTSSEGSFNDANPSLRRLLYAIGTEMKKNNTGIHITSMTRITNQYSPYSSSDHAIGKFVDGKWVFRGSPRREKLNGVDGNGVTKKYSEMGCAVDMHGKLPNGAIDKTNASIPLFHLIATKFTNNIRQLIWEVKTGASTADNAISNCVHLASYGARGANGNDKTEIYVSSGADPWKVVIADNAGDITKAPTNLPPLFVRTLYDMSKNGKLTSEVMLTNFTKANINTSMLTTEIFKQWCEQLHV